MAIIPEPTFPQPWADLTADFADRLRLTYDDLIEERRRLTELSNAAEKEADEALCLIEGPFDEVLGAISSVQRHVSSRRLKELSQILMQSPFCRQRPLINWLYDVAGCPRVADFLERANDLRLIVVRLLGEIQMPTEGKQSA